MSAFTIVAGKVAAVLRDSANNAITSVLDGAARRLQVEATITKSPGTEDTFGNVIGAQRFAQIGVSFFTGSPSQQLTLTTTGSGASAQTNGTGTFSTGATTTSSVKGVTRTSINYSAHFELYSAFTAAFTTPTSANSYQRIGLYDATNGFAFGYNGLTFGLWSRYNGVDTFVAQTSWNTDTLSAAAASKFTLNGTPQALAKTNINLYRIRFGWLGIANVVFEVLAPDGNFVVVHTIKYTNQQALVSVTNPNLPITVDVSKTGADATNLVVTCGCWTAGTTAAGNPGLSGAGTIAALNESVVLQVAEQSALGLLVTGTWTGTIALQASLDGVNWVADTVASAAVGGLFVSTIASAGSGVAQTFEATVAAFRFYRLIATAWTSGTATVTFNGSPNPSTIKAQSLITDANNNGPVSVKAANTAPSSTDYAMVVVLSPNQAAIPVTTSPTTSTPQLLVGDVALSSVTTAAIRRTAYTEQTTNFTGSIASSSASDTAAGTGARTVRITWMDSTGVTVGTEDVTLNGTTGVNLVTTTKCFIESIKVLTAGSTNSNVGIISLYTGANKTGTVVGTIAATDNTTFWAHHYVQSGKTCSVTSMSHGNTSTVSGGTSRATLRALPISANAAEITISDFLLIAGAASTDSRNYGSVIRVTGPTRITMYVQSFSAASITYAGSFDLYDV